MNILDVTWMTNKDFAMDMEMGTLRAMKQ